MEIIGYSERGVMNALFYGLTYKNDENGMKALLKLAGVKDPESFKDFKLYMEFSLSEFGDPDLVIIANKDTERVIIFVEAKSRLVIVAVISINKAFQKHAEIIAEKNSINGETSNLFFQLRLKHRLFETRNDIPNSEDEYIRKQKKDEPFNKIKMTRVREIEYYRSIGNNPVVRKFVDEIKECQSALYIAIVPEKDEIKDNKEECNKVRKELGEIYFISWQDILNNPSLKQYVGKTISYNQGPDPTIKSKKEKNQILNTPI